MIETQEHCTLSLENMSFITEGLLGTFVNLFFCVRFIWKVYLNKYYKMFVLCDVKTLNKYMNYFTALIHNVNKTKSLTF